MLQAVTTVKSYEISLQTDNANAAVNSSIESTHTKLHSVLL